MVKLITSIAAASALVISVKAFDVDAVPDVSLSLDEEVSLDAASIQFSEAFASEEASLSEAWNIEVVQDEDTGLGLMAQLSNYIQNLIHPEAEEADNLEETQEIQEAVEMNENEAVEQKKVKRSNYRRKLVKRAAPGPYQDENGHWHYPVPKSRKFSASRSVSAKRPEVTFDPALGLNEVPEIHEDAGKKLLTYPHFGHTKSASASAPELTFGPELLPFHENAASTSSDEDEWPMEILAFHENAASTSSDEDEWPMEILAFHENADEASSEEAPEDVEVDAEMEIAEQDLKDTVEMEAFPGFGPPNFFNPFLFDSLIPKSIKSEIAAKVKSKIEAAAATNAEFSKGLAKASELIGKATKAFEDFKNKHPKTDASDETEGAEEPTPAPESEDEGDV